ncbi:hypothetical protein CERSUDRAFT_50827 [Gelatoporia subvermispora B]|uniref:N-terminal nucleophile aminohydrolase n=1 Tax=Ceriporiopsis subvermispora (strain B) TaxID=914234 RepID=M2PN76_CERS8|nr:hypothetical protein CERSUDRAFT_50827 [Gelatoporia subvermispora B]
MSDEHFYLIAVHGGAGHHPASSDAQVKRALKSACTTALSTLAQGSSALNGVEDAITILENDECLNAGYGSNLTLCGGVECDASLMDAQTGDFGAVGAVTGIKNPVKLARVVLEHSRRPDPLGRIPPLLLTGHGAAQFAAMSGIETVGSESQVAPRVQREWSHWKSILDSATAASTQQDSQYTNQSILDAAESLYALQDTVGAVAWDQLSGLSAGVSSGGLLLKHPGRIGEAATYGAGCWANMTPDRNRAVACSVSGAGEYIIRTLLARKIAETIIFSDPNDTHDVLGRILQQFHEDCRARGEPDPHAGVLLLLREQSAEGVIIPRLWCAFTTESMAIAYALSLDAKPQVRLATRTHLNSCEHRVMNLADCHFT